MMKTFSLILLLSLFSCSLTKKEKTESYEPGFRIIKTVDKSRIYKADTDSNDNLHFRPLDIDIWYPARASETDSPLLFRDILSLLEKRANYYTASNKWTGITSQEAQSFCEGFKCSDTTRLLNFKTQSFMEASPVDTKFPLVIYLCAFNGMSYENFTFFETLAKKGFVVVSISSIGRYPGEMTMKNEDLLEQVDDAKASLNAIKKNSDIDFSKIGIIGYSWGGVSGAILAARIPRVSCLISLDGSEFHHYGEQNEENTDFNGIRNSPEFQNLNLHVPYLRLESLNIIDAKKEDSVYDFSEKLKNEKLIFEVDSAHHEDFSSLSAVVRESGNCPTNSNYNTILNLTLAYLEDHLKNAHSFLHSIEQEINKSITKK
jgi:Dienelactone hydrolase family